MRDFFHATEPAAELPHIPVRGLHVVVVAFVLALLVAGCRTPSEWREQADDAADAIIADAQQQAIHRTEPIRVNSPGESLRRRLLLLQDLPHSGPASRSIRDLESTLYWDRDVHLPPDRDVRVPWGSEELFRPTLMECLQIAARNSREFQDAKESIYRTALALDLERDDFRETFFGTLSALTTSNDIGYDRRYGFLGEADVGVSRKFRTGAELAGAIGIDLARLLSQERSSSLGIFGDASIRIPLMRGSGRKIVTEPLRQAERDVLYAIYNFERFKREFAVGIASEYLGVLLDARKVENQEENYKRLIASTRRARRLADSGRRPEFEFDQAVQNELRARDRWIAARQTYERSLDRFKMTLGLPPDANIALTDAELEDLQSRAAILAEGAAIADYSGEVPPADAPVELEEPSREDAGPLELDSRDAIIIALENRCDLRVTLGRVADAQRNMMVRADDLRAGLTLLGSTGIGEGRSIGTTAFPNAALDPDEMDYSALLEMDLPLERTFERNQYRNSLIILEQAVRDFQQAEDQVKLQVRDRLRALAQARQTVVIQAQAVELAEKRVHSTDLFLQAGRAQIRDLLEAQEDLLTAQNALVSALVNYRISEWQLQRDLGKLQVTVEGLWQEYTPERND